MRVSRKRYLSLLGPGPKVGINDRQKLSINIQNLKLNVNTEKTTFFCEDKKWVNIRVKQYPKYDNKNITGRFHHLFKKNKKFNEKYH